MGSPYFVHTQTSRVHVTKTSRGFFRILKTVLHSMGHGDFDEFMSKYENIHSPEWRSLRDIVDAGCRAASERKRAVLYLEARYEWTGWEKFQRVIVIDFSGAVESVRYDYLDLLALRAHFSEGEDAWTHKDERIVPSLEAEAPDSLKTQWYLAPFSFTI